MVALSNPTRIENSAKYEVFIKVPETEKWEYRMLCISSQHISEVAPETQKILIQHDTAELLSFKEIDSIDSIFGFVTIQSSLLLLDLLIYKLTSLCQRLFNHFFIAFLRRLALLCSPT